MQIIQELFNFTNILEPNMYYNNMLNCGSPIS